MRWYLETLKGLVTGFLIILNSILWSCFLFVVAAFLIIPSPSIQKRIFRLMDSLPIYWTTCNTVIINLMGLTKWEVKGTATLEANDWYLLISNHQSWLDILVLFHVFNHKIPTLKFFMKRPLLWQLPIISQACWLMGFPFMTKHTKDQIRQNPKLAGKDLENTRRSCHRFKYHPTTIMNFIEGSRFTVARHRRQNSPYRYLLKPKAGGAAFVLAAMGGYLNKIIDVTLVYPQGDITIWDFACGRVEKVIVNVETMPITAHMLGDYQNDREFRTRFQGMLNALWERKDKLIREILEKEGKIPLSESMFPEQVKKELQNIEV